MSELTEQPWLPTPRQNFDWGLDIPLPPSNYPTPQYVLSLPMGAPLPSVLFQIPEGPPLYKDASTFYWVYQAHGPVVWDGQPQVGMIIPIDPRGGLNFNLPAELSSSMVGQVDTPAAPNGVATPEPGAFWLLFCLFLVAISLAACRRADRKRRHE
jgi:hypothetical protein